MPSTSSISCTGVSGLIETDGLSPSFFIPLKVSLNSLHASLCTVIPSAPAFAKSLKYLIGSLIIRCTSKNMLLSFLMDSISGMPNEIDGTNNPSITSI